MRVYLMTDMEGVAGVLNADDWCLPSSAHLQAGRRLLTAETNAVVAGMLDGGAREVMVVDGHGHGGIDPELLHPDADLLRGPLTGPYPFGVEGFDVIAWVGQHAKAGTPRAHLPHTQSFSVIDVTINGESVGELGQMAHCAALFGVVPIFAAGDVAMTHEAQELLPGIETVAVKAGLNTGTGDDLDAASYQATFAGARHYARTRVRSDLRSGATRAALRWRDDPASFHRWTPPSVFRRSVRLRGIGGEPGVLLESEYDDLLSLLNDLEAFRPQPGKEPTS